MPTEPAPDVAPQLAHGDLLPLVSCDDCGCLVVPEKIRVHEVVCPGATKPGTITALMHRILGIVPGPKP